ncbi:phage tail terminator-like protein [Pseudomonas atacamensis]|uniref:phage tail terminator-like protein n=1 Tax=Pseudomonas atacamensis TaxID=2565368 RepID=UPI0030CB6A72
MSHNIIAAAFESRLLTWAKARAKPIKVVVENETYTPATGETYLRAFTLPALTGSNTLGGDHRVYTGVFQVNIVAPSGKYRTEASTIVDELAALFPLNLRIPRAGLVALVMTPVAPGPGIPDGNTFTVPASFQYRSDTN